MLWLIAFTVIISGIVLWIEWPQIVRWYMVSFKHEENVFPLRTRKIVNRSRKSRKAKETE